MPHRRNLAGKRDCPLVAFIKGRCTMRIWKTGAIAAALLPLAIAQALAAGKDVSSAEVQYQAGSSPLANVEMYQDINPKAPPLTKAPRW